MDMQAPSTRRQILDLLKKRGGMTAKELGDALGITSMAVRRHLAALERDDLIAAATVRRPMGRPSFVYSLTALADDLFPKNYPQLAISVLDDIRALDGDAKIDLLFKRREDRLFAAYSPDMEGKDLEGRVIELTRIMDENGYLSDYTRLDGSFRLTWHNCAIYKIAQHCPEACEHHLSLVSRLLNAEVVREAHSVKGDPSCSCVVRPR